MYLIALMNTILRRFHFDQHLLARPSIPNSEFLVPHKQAKPINFVMLMFESYFLYNL